MRTCGNKCKYAERQSKEVRSVPVMRCNRRCGREYSWQRSCLLRRSKSGHISNAGKHIGTMSRLNSYEISRVLRQPYGRGHRVTESQWLRDNAYAMSISRLSDR